MTPDNIEKGQEIFANIVARYYGDPEFKARMDANPAEVLREENMEIPEGVSVKLLFNTDNTLHIVLPYIKK